MKNSDSWRWAPIAAVAIAAVLVAGGCSPSGDDAGVPEQSAADSRVEGPPAPAVESARSVDGETVRGSADYDYDVASSVVEAAQAARTVVAGTVVSWTEGRAVRDGDDQRLSAVLEVLIDQAFATEEPVETIFVEVQRRGVLVDEAGNVLELDEGASYDERSVSDLENAVPIGTRVLVLAVDAPSDEEIAATGGGQQVVTSWSAPRDGAELVSPLPQGLLFEDADGTYVSGVADQADVEHGQWPAAQQARGTGALFEQLLAELSTELE